MKRLHIHIGVDDLEKSVCCNTTMLGKTPPEQKSDHKPGDENACCTPEPTKVEESSSCCTPKGGCC